MQFDYHVLRYISVPFPRPDAARSVFVLFSGDAIFGAQRGLYEGSYQPSEVAKLATILVYCPLAFLQRGPDQGC
jgi:cell division protein FtsW (lipid II flippase)